MKLNPLKPTVKPKHRYLQFKIFTDAALDKKDVSYALNGALLSFMGQANFGVAAPHTIEYDSTTNKGIIKVNLPAVEQVRAALTLVIEIKNYKATIAVQRVGGTLKSLRAKA